MEVIQLHIYYILKEMGIYNCVHFTHLRWLTVEYVAAMFVGGNKSS